MKSFTYTLPKTTEIIQNENILTIKTKLGELKLKFNNKLKNLKNIKITENENFKYLEINKIFGKKQYIQTYKQILENNIQGITTGFIKKIQLSGIGYKANIKNKILKLKVGFNHPIKKQIPEKIKIKILKNNTILIFGINKNEVNTYAALLKDIQQIEPYKGKGIKDENQIIKLKEGKKK